jgi:hypothetical protein
MKIRPLYDEYGAEGYYKAHADSYSNPHFPQIRELVNRNADKMDLAAVLDFGAGGGEVTRVLQESGLGGITGCDPFTFGLYEQQTGLPCLRLSFHDIIRNGLPGNFTTIISSFAMHLCPTKDLFSLTWNLFQAAPLLVIITPHKRPELENLSSFELVWQDFVCTERGKQVRLKAYKLTIDR